MIPVTHTAIAMHVLNMLGILVIIGLYTYTATARQDDTCVQDTLAVVRMHMLEWCVPKANIRRKIYYDRVTKQMQMYLEAFDAID